MQHRAGSVTPHGIKIARLVCWHSTGCCSWERRAQVVVRPGSCNLEIKFPDNRLILVLLFQVWVLEG